MFMQIREINDPIRTIMILQHPLDTLHFREASKEEVLDIYLFPTHEILEKEGKTLALLCVPLHHILHCNLQLPANSGEDYH